ncbi:unnamed protein product [Phytomonas sp. EM1]|nr:unnamed protein product [Phytomonas sp. EM1]|eukprot:CCW61758.1 unnamed protein product [Phytomonas sp. isolate EM1]
MSKEETKQVQPEATSQTRPPPATHDAPEKRRRDSAKELLEELDSGGFHLNHTVRLSALQRACMAVPNLTPLLTGDRRAKLYMRLLLDNKPQLEPIPESLASFATEATDDYHAAAITLMALLEPIPLEESEVVGFLCYLSSKTEFFPNEENLSLLNLVAVVLSDAQLSSGHTVLQLLFNFIQPLLKDFAIPMSSKPYDKTTTQLLRLILQYHDPALSIHFDQCHISIGELLLRWVRQFFVLDGEYRAALGTIDYLLVLGDPVLNPFVALAYIIANRQSLLSIHEAEVLRNALDTLKMELPGVKEAALDPWLVDGRSFAPMPVWSGKTLLQNADLLHRNTPQSTRRVLGLCLYPDMGSINKTFEELEAYYAGMPCLPLERSDIASSFSAKPHDPAEGTSLQYIIVDCRSQASFDYARLPTAVFVGDVVSFDADRLQEMVDRLMPTKGAHFSVFGTGRGIVEEANLLTIVILHLVQRHFPFVSLTAGGFKGLLTLIRSNLIRLTGSTAEAGEAGGKSLSAAVSELVADAMGAPAVQSMLSGLNEMRQTLLPRAAAEVGEVKGRAVQGLSAATAWGAGLVHRLQERLVAEPRSHPEAGASAHNGEEKGKGGEGASEPLQGRVLPRPAPPSHIFTLGGDDDNEDLDLIVAIPSVPVKGKVVATTAAAEAGEGGVEPPHVVNPSPVEKGAEDAKGEDPHLVGSDGKDATPSSPLEPVVANIDKEFEQLFGEISTPDRNAAAPSGAEVEKKDLDDDNDIFNDL